MLQRVMTIFSGHILKYILQIANSSPNIFGSCIHTCMHESVLVTHMGCLRLVGSLKLQVSFAKEPYKNDHIMQKRPIILRSLLIVATTYRKSPPVPFGTYANMPVSETLWWDAGSKNPSTTSASDPSPPTATTIYIYTHINKCVCIYIYIYIYTYGILVVRNSSSQS